MQARGIPLLDPLSLFIGKLHAWHHRDDPEKTSNDRLHLELLGEIIPKFLAEAKRRDVDIREHCDALLDFLDRHALVGRGFRRLAACLGIQIRRLINLGYPGEIFH